MKKRMSIGKTFELLGAIGLIASLVFVAYEIRQNTIAARASAIQEIGIATAEMWGEIARDQQLLRVMLKRSDIQTSDFSADDWSRMLAQMTAWSRMAETGLLQVREGLLPPASLETLGYSSTRNWLRSPVVSCLWKYRLKEMVSEDFASYVESGSNEAVVDCAEFESFPFLESSHVGPL